MRRPFYLIFVCLTFKLTKTTRLFSLCQTKQPYISLMTHVGKTLCNVIPLKSLGSVALTVAFSDVALCFVTWCSLSNGNSLYSIVHVVSKLPQLNTTATTTQARKQNSRSPCQWFGIKERRDHRG